MTRECGNDILVRLPNWVGDAVMATCVLRAVRAASPDRRICVAMRARLAELFGGCPFVDDVLPLEDQSVRESLRRARSLHGRFELALVLPNSFRAAILPWRAGVPRRIGYRGQWRRMLLTDTVVAPQGTGARRLPEPMPTYWRRLTDAAGIAWAGDAPSLSVTDQECEEAERCALGFGIEPGERLVGLSPGAAYGPSKLWGAEQFAAVAAVLHARHRLRSVVFLAPGEEDLGRAIIGAATSPIVSTVDNPVPLGLLKPFMQRCAVLVSTDSGTRHIGVAMGTPVVTVMGSTNPRYTEFCMERQVVVRKDVPCGPCHQKVCPTDHRCMQEISAEEVAGAASRFL